MVNPIEILGFYPLWLLLSGTIGNLITVRICYTQRKNTTFVFLMFITLADMATLYFWNLVSFLNAYNIMDLINYSLYSCRIGTFIQFTSLQCSAWLLVSFVQKICNMGNTNSLAFHELFIFKVLLSLDRLASLLCIKWKNILTAKRAIWVGFVLVFSFIAINFQIFFLYGEQLKINGTLKTFCYSIKDEATLLTGKWGVVSFLILHMT